MPNKNSKKKKNENRKMVRTSNGHVIGTWLKRIANDEFAGYCTICCKKVPCSNMGFRQILQHATGSKHIEFANLRFSKHQVHFVPQLSTERNVHANTSNSNNALAGQPAQGEGAQQLLVASRSHSDQVTKAELLWAMKVANGNFSFASCDNIAALFQEMFSCAYSNDFSCSSTKVAYLIKYALSPFFKQLLLDDLKKGNTGFTLELDETTTTQTKQQMDLVVRYWSPKLKRVVAQLH